MQREAVEMFVCFSLLPEIYHKSKITNGNNRNSFTNNSKSKAVFPLADVAQLAVL